MTPKTDSVAVLRNIRDRIEGCGDLSSAMKKPARLAALDAAIAALSAQGEAVAEVIPNVVGVEIAWSNPPSAGRPPVGTKLYTTPGVVGDAVTEDGESALWALRQILHDLPERRDWMDPDVEKVARALVERNRHADLTAALAARTGQGEANGR